MIVCPGNLAEQWQDELYQRFQLPFEILTNDKLESARTGNWFAENSMAICRLDKLSRNEDVQAKLANTDWDLVVCDEAHKMSATFFGSEVKYTKRYRLGQLLGQLTPHLLLMTATVASKHYQAVRYDSDGDPIPFYDFDHPGGSAIYASAHDLVRFGMFHLKNRLSGQKRILKDSSIDEMQRPTAKVEALAGYGVGWAIDSASPGWPLVSHTGGMGGVSTYPALLPKQNIAVAVVCNGRSNLPSEVVREILQVLEPARKRQSMTADNRHSRLPVGKWKGAVYTENGEIPLALDIRADKDVRAGLSSQPETRLSAVSYNAGYFRATMAGDIGTTDANRTKYVLAVELKLRGDTWNGGITARSLPAKRAGNALTYWVELRRDF